MRRAFRKISESREKMGRQLGEYLDEALDACHVLVNERGKRIVERHWFFRSAGNYRQQNEPKGTRRYSFVSPRYEDHGRQVYYRWTRFLFRTPADGGKRRKLLSPIPQTREKGYDLRKLKRGTTKWEQGAISKTERALMRVREANSIIVGMRRGVERLANALADLETLDREHYEQIREEIQALGFGWDEVDRLEKAHLEVMKRAREEGIDMRPLTESPIYAEGLLKPPPFAAKIRTEGDETHLPEIVEPKEEDWVPSAETMSRNELNVEEEQSREIENESPDPEIMDKLYRPWLYEDN